MEFKVEDVDPNEIPKALKGLPKQMEKAIDKFFEDNTRKAIKFPVEPLSIISIYYKLKNKYKNAVIHKTGNMIYITKVQK